MRERLERLALFDGLPDERLEELAAAASELTAPAGQVLLERGHPASGLFVLEAGTVAAEVGGGAEVELHAGDVFGEVPLVGLSERRTARVRAVTDVRSLAFARTELERILDREPRLLERLRTVAEQRLGAGEHA